MLAGMILAILLASMLLLTAAAEGQETVAEETTAQTEGTTPQTKEATTAAKAENTVAEKEETTTEGTETGSDTTEARNTSTDDSRQQNTQQAQADPNAEDDDAQATARASGPLADETAQITDSNDTDVIVNRIVVPDVNCEVSNSATVSVRDANGTRVRLTDGENVNITSNGDRILIVGRGTDGDLDGVNSSGQFGPSDGTQSGRLVGSSGITCDRANDGDGSGEGDDGRNNEGGNGRDADELEDLECRELLRRFRDLEDEQDEQYDDSAAFADIDVRNRIVICLEQEVVPGTAANKKLPNTGGLPLLGIAVLGVVSVVAGVSVIRGAGRNE